ncbi:MAG: DUF998 domain-containing protein [Thermoplasmatota archaeon]
MDFEDIEELIPEEVAGACGMVSPLIAYIFIGASILIHRSWFTWADNALSDLGAVGTPYNQVFNVGLILSGVLGLIFMLGALRIAEEKLGKLGIGIFGAGLVALILIGIFPSGTSPHYIVSILFFGLTAAGLLIFGIDQMWDFNEPVWGILVLTSIILPGIAVYLVYTIPYDLGAAIPEFIGSIPAVQFSLVFGAGLYFE